MGRHADQCSMDLTINISVHVFCEQGELLEMPVD